MIGFLRGGGGLIDGAFIIAIMTAYFYCVGAAYYSGYLMELDLDPNIMSRDFDRIIHDGFVLSLSPFIVFIFYTALFLFIFLLVAFEVKASLRKSYRFRRVVVRILTIFRYHSIRGIISNGYGLITFRVFMVAIISFVMVFCLKYYQDIGVGEAKNLKSLYFPVADRAAKNNIRVNVGGEVKGLIFLACGARNCAGFDADVGVLYYFPQNGHGYSVSASSPLAQ